MWRLLSVIAALPAASAAAVTLTLLADGDMSRWRYQVFDGIAETRYYSAMDDELGAAVLFAESDQGASGFTRPLSADLQKTPWLHFRWRVDRAGGGFDETQKSGDDFAYRLYFVARRHWRHKILLLVKSQNAAGTAWTSPYSGFRVHLQAYAVAGKEHPPGEWRAVSLNLLELWRRQFGFSPHLLQAGLMTDGDSAGAIMHARYGEIVLSDTPQSPFPPLAP